jgi:hypothetical protein
MIYIVKGGKETMDDKRYHEIAERAHQLNEDAPWIYSETWLKVFFEYLDTAFTIQDEEWVKELEESLK